MSASAAFDCRETFVRLNDYLDRELSSADTALVEAHLDACAHCTEIFDYEGRLLKQIKAKLASVEVPDSLRSKVESILKRAND